MPAYNPRHFEQALKSALSQDYPRLEILVCDDSGRDDIASICRRMSDDRIKHIKNESNLGFQKNFTKCFVLANGKYLKYLNDDDVLLPQCVSRMVNQFVLHGDQLKLVTSRRHVINERSEIQPDIAATQALAVVTSYMDGLDLGNFILAHSTNFIGEPSTVMFRKEDIKFQGENLFSLGKQEYHCLADFSLWLRLLSLGGAVYIADPLSLFRMHAGQEQKKMEVAIGCITERLAVVFAAKELGFLQNAAYFDHAMCAVEGYFLQNLSMPNLALQARTALQKAYSNIPAKYHSPNGTALMKAHQAMPTVR